MAKRYDPIMCMMVDEPTKAQDAMPSDLKKAGYEVGTVEKYGSTYYTLVYNGKVISTSPTEANIVEKAKKHYTNRHGKAHDSAFAIDKAISTCDAASGDAMKQIANTAKAWAKQYNQLFEKATTAEEVKKLKSQKDNDYRRAMDNLDKIYNEVSQAYGRARSEVRDLFDEVDSNGFKAYQRVTEK